MPHQTGLAPHLYDSGRRVDADKLVRTGQNLRLPLLNKEKGLTPPKEYGENRDWNVDPLSHFEHDTDEVIELYQKLTGQKLDMEIEEEKTEEGTEQPK